MYCHPLAELHAICERYVQCQTMATLDERLCFGNSRSMPFWLPPKNKEDYTAQQCHEKLKPFYKKLEQMESEKSGQLLACLLEQATPMNFDKQKECHRDLLAFPRYNYSGDPMARVPTQCFQGIKRRIAKECAPLKNCCNSFENCAHLENSDVALKIHQLKHFIKEFGKKCQLGVEKHFNFDAENQEENNFGEHQPTGNINITVRNLEDNIQASEARIPSERRLLVKIVTAEEEIQRLKNAGKTEDAKKLIRELEKIQNSTENSETVLTSTLSTTTEFSTTSAVAPTTEASTTSSSTVGDLSTTQIVLRNAPSFITAPQPLQDEDPPVHHPWHHPNYPKTITANQPLDLNDELKKFSHVKTLHRLVEQFKDKNPDMIPVEGM
uniref:Uncharacterized protein n=1 Tax=Panagrolaimus sp. JU765 TaxID=591449 RepID=A0AC34RAC9_9BILA